MRIVSICPSNTELLAYLEEEGQLVGVDDYSDWPERVNRLPRVGPDLSIDVAKVAQLQPDLVLASLSVPGMEHNISQLDDAALPYIILDPDSLEDIANDLRTLGEAIGLREKADEKADQFLAELQFYRERASTVSSPPSLYWEWWPKPIFTPGRPNWLTEISTLAGGWNIFSTEDKASVQTDWDDVLERNPEHICMVWVGVQENKMNPDLLLKRPGWREMEAMQKNRVHVLEESLYCRPSPRLLEGLDKLARLLHPDLFAG
ncbi:cobalamin-binding protein [Thalassobacillus sp. CUG 92003]|uniref:cobalamin-binding protein n=1 Tax=Thalassobacillus sp. CUG 92003 TaxID=2736641 RepID=UPI0015E7D479|nr:cobalamin-binding protein [Thalassobacillus sp. CUG 92003]